MTPNAPVPTAEVDHACGSTIVLNMGVERCADCGRLAGGDVFVTLGTPLPTKAPRRKAVR